MAHLNWHGQIIRVYKSNTSNRRYHITDTGKVLRTDGPKLGKCKVVRTERFGGKFMEAAIWEEKNAVALSANYTIE